MLGEPRGLFGRQRQRRGSGSDGNSGMLSRDQGGGGDHDERSEKRWTWGGGSGAGHQPLERPVGEIGDRPRFLYTRPFNLQKTWSVPYFLGGGELA